MARFYGAIGYGVAEETSPGVWTDNIIEHYYSGDVLRNGSNRSASSDSTNDNITINNQFSIVADPFAYQNFHNMRYIEFMGTKWEITNIDVEYPRLTLSVGGVYNG